jgi:hypothetical protein
MLKRVHLYVLFSDKTQQDINSDKFYNFNINCCLKCLKWNTFWMCSGIENLSWLIRNVPYSKCQFAVNRRWNDISLEFFFISYGGTLGTAAAAGLLYQPRMIGDGDCGEIGGMKIGRGNWSTWRTPAQAPLCPPQIPQDYTRFWTRAAAVGSQRLTAWAMARPFSGV